MENRKLSIGESSDGKQPRGRRLTESRRNAISGYLFIAPIYIIFGIFSLFPIFFSFYIGFFSWDGFGGLENLEFVGWNNFEIVLNDPLFWRSVYNTFIIGVIGTAPQLIVAILLASALNSYMARFVNVFRIAIFLPFVTSIVAVAIIFSFIFSDQPFGLVNTVLGIFGMEPVTWSRSEWGAKIAISTMIFWRWVGYNTIIYLAGMQSIPKDLYEAATVEGASAYQRFRYITIPMLRPFIIFTVFTATVGALQIFAEPMIFSEYRPEGMTVVLYLYREGFANNFFGTAAASSLILFVLIIVVTGINFLLSNRIGRADKRRF